jgi:hypothetical protein
MSWTQDLSGLGGQIMELGHVVRSVANPRRIHVDSVAQLARLRLSAPTDVLDQESRTAEDVATLDDQAERAAVGC